MISNYKSLFDELNDQIDEIKCLFNYNEPDELKYLRTSIQDLKNQKHQILKEKRKEYNARINFI